MVLVYIKERAILLVVHIIVVVVNVVGLEHIVGHMQEKNPVVVAPLLPHVPPKLVLN